MPPPAGALTRPLEPLVQTIRGYSLRKFRSDAIAGVTVSVVELPQAMAYALIAGVPPQYGIYTSIIQGVLGALLSSSQHLTTGPTNTQALLIASAVGRVAGAPENPALYLQLVFMLTLLKGLVQLGFSAARFGELVRFISRSVLLGVSSGAGVLIIFGQVSNFLGLPATGTSTLPGVIGAVQKLLPDLTHPNPRAVGIAVAVLAVIVVGRRISRFFPGSLLGVIGAAAAVALLGWQDQVPTIGELSGGLPHLVLPYVGADEIVALLPGALALALLGGIESIAIGKTIGARSGERIAANGEFFAQGVANAASSFFQCIPGSGSFTRSALDHDAGAKTRFAAVINALVIAALFVLLADFARFIPLAALAAVLFVVAFQLIQFTYPLRVWRADHSDAIVFLVTLFATVLLPLEYAIFTGIFLNIAFYLQSASRLHMNEIVPTAGGTFLERPIYDRAGQRQVLFLQLEGELFFAVADELHEQLHAVRRSGVRVVILRLRRTHSIDASVLHVLEQFIQDMRSSGAHVLLCGLREELKDRLDRYGLLKLIGRENVFMTGGGVFTSAKRAVQRARELIDRSIDTTGLRREDLEDEIEYQI
jgi:SulP family sulfate permease